MQIKRCVEVPTLDIDAILYRDRDGKPHVNGVLERRIVANLIAHLTAKGFNMVAVFDGDEFTPVTDMKSAMEVIFNLDEASLRVLKPGGSYSEHGVLLVMGNGVDIISDWNYTSGDRDGFDAAMNEFNAEDFA